MPAIINEVDIVQDIEESYTGYAYAVIQDRAISNTEDNQKPSSLTVLYAMNQMGITSSGKHVKVARIIGEVLGKYHPHGDSSVHGTIVNMAQDFNNNIPYIDPNGNFGSIANDSAAAPRYIEAKLSWYAEKVVLKDLAKGVVEYRNNYDDTTTMPCYLPEVLPDLLINGNMGIGVGFASYLLPHNLGDVINLCIEYVKNRNITPEEMYEIIKGPDFPLGGIINGTDGLKRVYTSGDGYVRIRGEYKLEQDKKTGIDRIVITSIPYGTYIPDITMSIGSLVDAGELNIKDIRDETTQATGIRICIDLAKGESIDRVISLLIHKTPFEKVLKPLHNLLVNGKFKEKVNIKDIMSSFIAFREKCLHNKFMLELKAKEDRLHILQGLFIVTKDIDKAVKIIRNAKDNQDAKATLMKVFKLSEPQAQYILDLKLARLTKLNMSDAREEEKNVTERIKTLTRITRTVSNKEVDAYMIAEWEEIRNLREAKPYLTRKTKIQKKREEVTLDDTIPDTPCNIIITKKGYIKRTEDLNKEQKRGGKGSSVGTLQEDDEISQVINTSTRNTLIFLTSKGRIYSKKVYEIEPVSRLARGQLARNVLSLRESENVVLVFVNDVEDGNIISCSLKGMVKSTDLKNIRNIQANGKNLIGVESGDKIVDIVIIPKERECKDVIIATRNGMCIRIDSTEVRPTGVGAYGVIGIKLNKEEKDYVASMCKVGEKPIVFISESGHVKRVNPNEFKLQNKNGVGVKCTNTSRNNYIVVMKSQEDMSNLLIYTKYGKSILCNLDDVRMVGRTSQGVKGINLVKDDLVIGAELI